MIQHIKTKCRLLLAAAVIPLGYSGCGSSQARFTPTKDEARASLEKALAAWSKGAACGAIESTPPIQVVDSDWLGGSRIESFEIGAEEEIEEGAKQFEVKLTRKPAKGAPSVDAVRYVVYGRAPVYVFREDDYQRTLNMDNNPGGTARGPVRRGRRSRL